MTADRAASIRARLEQHPETSTQDFHLSLTQYGLERLLCRLSIAGRAPNFLLDGALLFQLWYGQSHHPTRDADLLGFGPDDLPTLVGVFRSIHSIAVDDAIVFDPESVAGTETSKDAGYGGVRIDARATLAVRAWPCASTSTSAMRSRPRKLAVACSRAWRSDHSSNLSSRQRHTLDTSNAWSSS
jgi:Nucleotidyl transferase AbiEii toxin, Type IV TA system